MRDGQWGHGDQLEYDDQWVLRRREVCLQIITDLVMAIRILDKDITQRYWILQRSLGCPDQRRKGWGNDLRNSDGLTWILEQVLYLFEGTYSVYFYRYS